MTVNRLHASQGNLSVRLAGYTNFVSSQMDTLRGLVTFPNTLCDCNFLSTARLCRNSRQQRCHTLKLKIRHMFWQNVNVAQKKLINKIKRFSDSKNWTLRIIFPKNQYVGSFGVPGVEILAPKVSNHLTSYHQSTTKPKVKVRERFNKYEAVKI